MMRLPPNYLQMTTFNKVTPDTPTNGENNKTIENDEEKMKNKLIGKQIMNS